MCHASSPSRWSILLDLSWWSISPQLALGLPLSSGVRRKSVELCDCARFIEAIESKLFATAVSFLFSASQYMASSARKVFYTKGIYSAEH